ncbi:MAG: response regulator [Ardenticatenales bacterium]|nr:response regulator [Ardenticatenales bacterium]
MPTQAQAKILIMEDDGQLCDLFSRALRHAGYEVYTASTLRAAQAHLDQHKFDMFLCDLHIGQDRALRLLQEQAATLISQGTQIVVMSAESQYRGSCEDLGIDFYLEKPVLPQTLLGFVERLLSAPTSSIN